MASLKVGGTYLHAQRLWVWALLALGLQWCQPSGAQLGPFVIQFDQQVYNPILPEEQPIGTEVVVIGARYFDSFGISFSDGAFSIPSGGDAQLFTIEEASGVVRTAAVFDRDVPNAQTIFEFDVSYTVPDQSVTTSVLARVTLEDVNDNAPRFTERVFDATLFEETPGGTSFFTVTAVDPDLVLVTQTIDEENEDFGEPVFLVDHGKISYTVTEGNELEHFVINADDGILSVAPGVVLDVDLISLYNLTVVAEDGPGLSDTATVLVNVLDSNDNQPQILSPSSFELTISEDAPLGFVVLDSINATDADRGLNAAIQFLILDGDVTNSFNINEITGEIVVSAPLDRESGEAVTLIVAARDQGLPPLQDTIVIVINLLDINDFPPTFAQETFEATVSENVGVGTSVVRFEAVDLDEGPNGTVTYSLLEGGDGKFKVDSQTGEICTNGSIDREEVDSYFLVIEAVDNPVNSSFQLSSVVNVTILVGDVNDNSPLFQQESYMVQILDTLRRFDHVIQVQAFDLDAGSNGQVTYRIEVPDLEDPDAFAIWSNTGIVYINRRVIFENQRVYTFTIRALDNGAVRFGTDVELTVVIHNENENPPVFDQEEYNTTRNETVAISEVVLTVSARDPDAGAIGEVRYRIASEFDEAGSFEVNETTGEVYVNSTLDFDVREYIFFQIEAYDGGFPQPFTDTTNITVFLTEENDEAPSIIFPNGFQIFVPENTAPPIDVVVLLDFTFDPDLGPGGEFVFAIAEIYDPVAQNESFSINETTGLITSLRTFNREAQPEGIMVAIETTDFGIPEQSKITNITILIGDKNDEAPYFPTNESTTVYEFLPPGAEVLAEYRAVDDDIDQNAELEYEIFAGDEFGRFSVNRSTGGIYTNAVLNKTEQRFYNLTIITMDSGIPQFFGFGQVFIEVVDANDQIPIFSETVYNASVPENSPIGTPVIQVNATDADIGTNADFEYFLSPNSSNTERFEINSTTGVVSTLEVFDRENETSLELTVVAVDMGVVPLSGTTTVLVYIQDTNDETPVFNETRVEVEVVENSPTDTFVASVFAYDLDAEAPNNVVRYSLSGNRSDVFRIDPVTGEVFVNGTVDWEEGADFVIVAIATDQGYPPLSAEADIVVMIEDVNDRAPVFTPESLDLSIPEDSAPGTTVGSVKAIDPDSPGNVSYSVLMDFSNGRFQLDGDTGLVTFVRGSLNREQRSFFDLVIRATDHGSPPLFMDATLIINVLDSNDFDPVFDQEVFTGSIPENSPSGTPILTIHATDNDIGNNADLRYAITDPYYLRYFEVNETTGTITTTDNILDFEGTTLYVFVVTVSDQGTPPRSDTASVRISVTDRNDHPPVFEETEYSSTLRENLAPGTTVLRVNTTDVDTEENADVEYSLRPTPGSALFGVHPESGVIYTAEYINREETPYVNLIVVANNSFADIPLFNETQVFINITDLNDMHPTFNLVTEIYVPENASTNSTVYILTAVDGDEGLNGTVSYVILRGNEEAIFQLDSQTGGLMLLQELDFEERSLYVLAVRADDGGTPSLSNYTNVLVHVVDSNDHRPRFTSSEYSVTVNAEVAVGTTVASIVALDNDSSSRLVYSITAGNSMGLFELVSQEEGTLVTSTQLSSFDDMNFTLTLQVSDSDYSVSVQIVIYVQSVDISLPIFTQLAYEASIPEDAMSGDTVFGFESTHTMNANDFQIESGDMGGLFSIDSFGAVTLALPSLDFETQSVYQLGISISNTAGEKAFAILTISVTDVNEHPPEFVLSSFFAAIPETIAVGEPFFTPLAVDRDGSTPANDISYSITSTHPEILTTFQIDPQSGALSVSRQLDYEGGDRNFTFSVNASNEAVLPFSTETTVEILVLNGNNHMPQFDVVTQSVSPPLTENGPIGINIANVSAFDGDMGSQGEITYGMHGDHRYLDFSIDTFTGEIFINYPLDYERHTFYSLDVVASDGGNPNMFAVARVLVQVVDENDNDPIWQQSLYSAEVPEDAPVGSTVIQVTATDADQVDQTTIGGELVIFIRNGYVNYSISDGDPENQFRIDRMDPGMGVITIVSPLDRETYPEYNLTLNATDGGGRFANAYLHVVVHDINDELPQFSESPYRVGVPENSDNGTFIVQVMATDTDLNLNSIFFFDITGGNINDTFVLNATTGEMLLDKAIDRENIASYTLVVEAVDLGVIPLTGTVEVLVNVLDINEFPPVFSEEQYTGEVFENEPEGTVVLQVSASDLDFEENATVLFAIVPGNGTDPIGPFNINSTSGDIFVAGFLDFETENEYHLVVMATDSGPNSTRLSSEANVTIFVRDRNDNSPQFSQEGYTISVFENSPPETPVLTVNVSDADSGSNAQLELSLDYLGDSEAEINFVIDPQSGVVTLLDSTNLDRERTSSYQLLVNATDSGDPPLRSSVPLTIVIGDRNDNHPQFTETIFEGSLFENQPVGTPAISVGATDEDEEENAAVVFEIAGVVQSEFECISNCNNAPLCQSVFSSAVSPNFPVIPPFFINEQSGQIFSNESFDREGINEYILLVLATDSAMNETRLSNTTCAHVDILDQNDEHPQFNQSLYEASISEYTVEGIMVIQVFASDADLSSNAEITYQLLSGTGSFTVHPQTGEIFSLGDYDRETRDSYNVTVEAVDGGDSPLSSTVVVIVTILDENDSPPEFSAPLYFTTVEENLPAGSTVIQLNATDMDVSSNAEIVYSIESSIPENHFELDPLSGVVSTIQALDRESIGSYILAIVATDQGNPPLSTSTQLNITVVDTNDLAPSFLNTPYLVQIEENFAPTDPILTIQAEDGDLGTNSDIVFTLFAVSPNSSDFHVNSSTGELTLVTLLDAESALSYDLTIVAHNGPALPLQQSETVVRVEVIDENDHAPQFEQVDYTVPVLEASAVGLEVIQLLASDLDATDTNSRLTFMVVGGHNTSLFEIHPTLGIITVEASLDRESEPRHVLEVEVLDSGIPVLSDTTTVTIVVQDFNDNSPVFEQSGYDFSIQENQSELTTVGQITANDVDLQQISYFIPENATDGASFFINATTGEIFSAVIFDRESQDFYSFIAIATDNGINLARTAEVAVNVTILDLNDVTPLFSEEVYDISWYENTTVSTILLTVEAVDEDLGQNSMVEYSILPNNDSLFFSINSSSGEIVLDQELDRELQDFFQFNITAHDFGTPSLTGTATVQLQVLDNNDNIPVLNASQYEAALREDTAVGSVAVYIGASDRDIDLNAEIRFSLSEDFDGTFTIGDSSGVLTLTRSLDYEFTQSYNFSVIATDVGQPPLSSSSPVSIEVLDLNDNPPVFDSPIYQVSVPENAILDTPVFHFPATDADSTSNGELRYSILSGNLEARFAVDEVTGAITVSRYLDREIIEFYSLALRAVDLGTPQLTASAQLSITVVDVNDHLPEFTSQSYSVLIQETESVGTVVFTVEASDSDIGRNANLTYAIIGGNADQSFELDSTSGEISIASPLDFETSPAYTLSIEVSDNGLPTPLYDIATLRILIADENEQPPLFASDFYSITLSENTVIGAAIGYFTAVDRDTNSGTAVRYTLLGSEEDVPVAVDRLTGRVYVSSELYPSNFTLNLEADDGTFTTEVEIFVTIVALTSPVSLFEPAAFYFEVSEATTPVSLIGQLNTTIPAMVSMVDSNSSIENMFEVQSGGRINLIGQLDVETTSAYVFGVQSYVDDQEPSFAVVTIIVMDYNEFPPVFESPEYRAVTSELTPVGTTLLYLSASDRDLPGETSEFEMVISEGNEDRVFALDPNTGALSIARMLDFEAQSSYLLTANVSNHLASPVLFSTAAIEITLEDENDNNPSFSQMFYQVQIPESTPLGTEILVLGASDPDSGTNSDLVFSITHLDTPLSFTINRTSGAIATNVTFDLQGIATSYIISAMVADRGSPQPRSDSTTVFVEVTPDNNFAPMFTQPEGYFIEIPETLPVGGSVLQLSASDPDTILPLSVTYTIQSGDPEEQFEIDPSTGLISLVSSLDFQAQSFYSLSVEATDFGYPPRSSSIQVNISVMDINNHDPQFSQNSYEVTIVENIELSTAVLQVSAEDPDATSLTYTLTVNVFENGAPLFDINATSGEISTVSTIDREFSDRLELLVSAIDSGYSVQRSRSVPVTVLVQDLNDNPPEFDQTEYTFPVLRFLAPGQTVTMVTATDADLIGEELTYQITSDSSGGLLEIIPATGEIVTALRVPEEAMGVYELTVTAFDGSFNTTVPVHMELISDGNFCNGFCTSVLSVNCTFDIFPFIECNPFCTGDHALSPERTLCLFFYCLDSTLAPCESLSVCLPPSEACAGVCPSGMAVCPTTNLCHPFTSSTPCDTSNDTCLLGQTLVQREDGMRYCAISESLSPNGESCVGESMVYCELLDNCSDISAPFLCQPCPNGLVGCSDTGECVPDLRQCCGPDGYYCEVLDQCLDIGDRCELPNIAPAIQSDLIYLESITSFSTDSIYSSQGHVVGLLLSNSTSLATDSQGEELGVAIVEMPDTPPSYGEWQYALCSDAESDSYGSCNISSPWVTIAGISETNALVLPNIARLRFVRRAVEFDGAVWMRVKVWDGNQDGFLSPATNLVRSSEPHHDTTIPFTMNGAFSENTTLLVILIHPLIEPPSFSDLASLQFSTIQEDSFFVTNRGNTISDVVFSVTVPAFRVISEDMIEGLPDVAPNVAAESYEELLPNQVRDNFYSQVEVVNPTRKQRQTAMESGQHPGVVVTIDTDSMAGVWQVSLDGDTRLFAFLDTLLPDTNWTLLLNTSARLRFLPQNDFCGSATILIRPWDGYWNDSVAMQLESGYIVGLPGSETILQSQYNVNEWLIAMIEVVCVPNKPVIIEDQIQLDPIPYRLAYRYERLFTALVARESESLRVERERLTDFLQLILQQGVDIRRIAPSTSTSTYVSFSLEGDTLSFDNVQQQILERREALADLDFSVLSLSQDASYGPGASCPGDSPQHYHGVQVNTIASRSASDGDQDFLGLAVISVSPVEGGTWQYYRGNWSGTNEFNPNSSIWVILPTELSETRALLLHGNDRLRFLPQPHFYWLDGGSELPSIQIKVWDYSLIDDSLNAQTEISRMNINTDPFTDTIQSLFHPIGLFSDSITVIEAARYGCDGAINSGLVHDACCVCGGSGDACRGCNGVIGSNAVYDACDTCGGDDTSCLGCDFIPYSNTGMGLCGECVSDVLLPTGDTSAELLYPVSSFTDCGGTCYGTALLDDCGVCSGGGTSHEYNSNMDCVGVCFGNATVDSCGDCTGPGTGLTLNHNLDCTGICGGPFVADSCEICQLPDEEGNVVEYRDCAGVCFGEAELDVCGECFGGDTGVLADVMLDECSVCGGDNSSCFGCDGVANSGSRIDSCDTCGGNDCGCFMIDFITPERGPRTGGTEIIIHGAGFFLNDTALLNFTFNPQSENCGAPFRYPNGNSIPVTCQFVASGQQLQGFAVPINQSAFRCVTESTADSQTYIPEFALQVRIADGPLSNALTFHYDDYSVIDVTQLVPDNAEVGQEATVRYLGTNFINTSVTACLVYDFSSCVSDFSQESPLQLPATYYSNSEISCQLPRAEFPCRITVRLSLDGQESGILESLPTISQFTYLFSAPEVRSVHFSDDLSNLIVQFDRQVELANDALISCENIFSTATFSLIGGTTASCFWSTNLQHEIVLILPSNATVQVGSPISFRDNIIQTQGELYSYTVDNQTTLVDSEINAIKPVAILNGPSSIPACGTATFTATYSLHSGYGGFEYKWSIFLLDITTDRFEGIIQYLNSLPADSQSISLDSSLFIPDVEYYLELYVINSIGLQSDSTIVSLFKEEEPQPQVSFTGSSIRVLNPGEDLLVETSVIPSQCGDVNSQFVFNWQLFRITDLRRLLLAEEDLSALPTQSPDIFIPAGYFTQNSSYTLTLTVTGEEQFSSTISIDVSVLPSLLQARIHGGNRSVSQARTLVLDASSSGLIPNLPDASYVWSCKVADTSEPCYSQSELLPTPIRIPKAEFVTVPGSNLEADKAYSFMLTLSQGIQVSEQTVLIYIVPSPLPIVEILPLTGDISSSSDITLEGLVYSSLSTEAVQWESLQLPGQSYVDLSDPRVVQSQTQYPTTPTTTVELTADGVIVTPAAYIAPNEVSRANLVLRPNVLTPGATYTFQLSASNSEGTGFAQVSITPNVPPHSATIAVDPSSGVALESEFMITVSDVRDSTVDTPPLYQFGFFQDLPVSETVSDDNILWLSGIQSSNSIKTLLPTGDSSSNFKLHIVARTFDRKGGKSDVISEVVVNDNNQLSRESFYMTLLQNIRTNLQSNNDWNTALSELAGIVFEINRNLLTSSQSLKEQSVDLLLDIFSSFLPATQTHYDLSALLLSQITTNIGISDSSRQVRIAQNLEQTVNWFRDQVLFTSVSTGMQTQASGEPLLLLSTYRRALNSNLLSSETVRNLLTSWVNIVENSRVSSVSSSFIGSVESLGYTLCKQSSYGEESSQFETSLAKVYAKATIPMGTFNVSGVVLDFGTSLAEVYQSQACVADNIACSETCLQGVRYPFDFFADTASSVIQLSNTAAERVLSEVEGSNPNGVVLISEIVSAVISIPSQDGFLDASNLDDPVNVYIPFSTPLPDDESKPFCLFRPVGGNSGFNDFEWQLDTLTPPRTATVDSKQYLVCEFTHLSEFAIGLLPPPVITEPPTTTTTTTSSVVQSTSSSQVSTETSSVVTTETPSPPVSQTAGGAPIAVFAIVPIIAVAAVMTAVGILFLVWKKKRSRRVKVAPDAGIPSTSEPLSEEEREREKAKLMKASPLTPEESKIPMEIIQLLDSGERSSLGTMNVLPSIRLRELRHEVGEHFTVFKKKRFYFLTRQLCDIEPATEQQQFVSLVFGETTNQPIFLRDVAVVNEQTRLHFCICGNAAQFECSSCSSQGYCSPECQITHWSEQHQRECNRLSEKKRRSEILLRRQSTTLTATSPMQDRPQGLTYGSPPVSQLQKPLSPTTPSDWKSFLSSTRPFQQPPLSRDRMVSTKPQVSHLVSPQSPQKIPIAPARLSPPTTGTTLGQLALKQPLHTSQLGADVQTPADLSQRPLAKFPSSGPYNPSRRQLPPLAKSHSLTAAAPVLHTAPKGAFLSPPPTAGTLSSTSPPIRTPAHDLSYGSTSQNRLGSLWSPQPYLQPFFTKADPRQISQVQHPFARPLSIYSVGSEDLGLSMSISAGRFRDVRNEPLLESDEEYESSESDSQTRTPSARTEEARSPSQHTGSRPPSLAVRRKQPFGRRSQASQGSTASSDTAAGSESESSSDDESKPLSAQSTSKAKNIAAVSSSTGRPNEDETSQAIEQQQGPNTESPKEQQINSKDEHSNESA